VTDHEQQAFQWAMGLIQQAMRNGAYGRVTVILEAGQVVRAQVETQEKPPNDQQVRRPRVVPG
jgi:hypothetical protein